jgi:hypothetical protein
MRSSWRASLDLDRVKLLVRDLYVELGLDANVTQTPRKRPVEVRYEAAPNGGTFAIDVDEDGNEVGRQYVPGRTVTTGLKSTED